MLTGLKVLQAQHIDMGPAEYIGTKLLDTLQPMQRTLLVKQLELVKEFSGREAPGRDGAGDRDLGGRPGQGGCRLIRAEASCAT